MDYSIIYDFCKVRNHGNALSNGIKDYPPRVKFILHLLDEKGIEYEIDTFLYNKNHLHNIYLKGSSSKWVMAHHDVYNHKIDNANDNSASIINAIALKIIRPDINIALVDGEEAPCFGAGSSRFVEKVKSGELKTKWVLNLELTGTGGTNFFIGNYDTKLTHKIQEKFGCAIMDVPFNDATILHSANINTALINPCPLLPSELVIKQVGIANSIISELKYEIREGDSIPKKIYDYIISKLDDLTLDKESEFIVAKQPIIIPTGSMPRIDQMDISILHRCHHPSDNIKHLRLDDMKDFVEKVLCVIVDID